MAADRQGFGDLIDDDDSDCAAEHSVVVPFPEPRSGSKRPAAKALAAEVRCWLCTEPGATSTWKQFQCHDKCVNALRCHTRMVDPKDRELDEGWLQEEPEAFKEAVLPLVDVQQNGFRDRKVLQKHRDAVVQYFTKTS